MLTLCDFSESTATDLQRGYYGLKKKLGFYQRPNKSTAHEQWVTDEPFRKVTVDKHLSPFNVVLVQSMAKQAGLEVKEFCRYCKDKDYP